MVIFLNGDENNLINFLILLEKSYLSNKNAINDDWHFMLVMEQFNYEQLQLYFFLRF